MTRGHARRLAQLEHRHQGPDARLVADIQRWARLESSVIDLALRYLDATTAQDAPTIADIRQEARLARVVLGNSEARR